MMVAKIIVNNSDLKRESQGKSCIFLLFFIAYPTIYPVLVIIMIKLKFKMYRF